MAAPVRQPLDRWYATSRRARRSASPYLLDVSPNYFATMGISLIAGRDLRPGDKQPHLSELSERVAGVGVVNEAFARGYFRGENPVGRTVHLRKKKDMTVPMQIIGLVRDAVYYDLREPIRPTVYVPLQAREQATVLVRTAIDAPSLVPALRQQVSSHGRV